MNLQESSINSYRNGQSDERHERIKSRRASVYFLMDIKYNFSLVIITLKLLTLVRLKR